MSDQLMIYYLHQIKFQTQSLYTIFCIFLFQSIKEKSEQEAKEKKFSFEVANKSDNRRLNRYRDVNPYDHSRIILHRGDVDYINANLVTVIFSLGNINCDHLI